MAHSKLFDASNTLKHHTPFLAVNETRCWDCPVPGRPHNEHDYVDLALTSALNYLSCSSPIDPFAGSLAERRDGSQGHAV
jgi:hypothetical protein